MAELRQEIEGENRRSGAEAQRKSAAIGEPLSKDYPGPHCIRSPRPDQIVVTLASPSERL
jgi:hypothetical protein